MAGAGLQRVLATAQAQSLHHLEAHRLRGSEVIDPLLCFGATVLLLGAPIEGLCPVPGAQCVVCGLVPLLAPLAPHAYQPGLEIQLIESQAGELKPHEPALSPHCKLHKKPARRSIRRKKKTTAKKDDS